MSRQPTPKPVGSNPQPRLRREFVLGLTRHWPDLFDNLERDDPRDVAAWAAHQGTGITDPWLVMVLAQTLAFRRIRGGTPVEVLPSWFADYGNGRIAGPGPFNGNRGIGKHETTDEYAKRMRSALSAHLEYVRDSRDERRANPSWDDDIRWAVQMLSGKTQQQIQELGNDPAQRPLPQLPELARARKGELKAGHWQAVSEWEPLTTDIDADAIRQRARRFARKIGLTIPSSRPH